MDKSMTFSEVVYQLRGSSDARQRAVIEDVLNAIDAVGRAGRSLAGLHAVHRLNEPESYRRESWAEAYYPPLAAELARALRSTADTIPAAGEPSEPHDAEGAGEFQPEPVPKTALLHFRLDAAEYRLERIAKAVKIAFPNKFDNADLGFADSDLD